jgi:predicted transcriptional regulator
MKEKILELREKGYSYKKICDELNCSKGTVSYHLGENQKEKTLNRKRNMRQNVLVRKLETFKHRKKRYVDEMIRKFNKRDGSLSKKDKINKKIETSFTLDDVIEKYGVDTICYLSGEKINLFENNYNFDHIHPSSKGGDNSLENLGIAHNITNKMKGDLLVEELFEWCKKILEHNGYMVTKK